MEKIHRRQISKKLLLGAAMFVALTTGAGVIHAGYKWGAVEVSFTGTAAAGTFAGTMGSARASADSQQYIGCEVQWTGPNANNTATVSPTNIGYCFSRDKTGATRSCYVTIKYGTAASLLANVNPNSYIGVQYFQTSDGTSYCSWIGINNYSFNPVEVN